MAQARMRVSCMSDSPPCLQMVPAVNVIYSDVWTDPAQATPGAPINLRYDDATQFKTAFPTSAACVTAWAANCRIVINYPQHLQPLWDLPRQTTDADGRGADRSHLHAGRLPQPEGCHGCGPGPRRQSGSHQRAFGR